MFGKAKEALREKAEIFIKGNTPTMTQSECRETMETAGDCQALLNHLENETKMKELCGKGYFTIEKGKNAYCVDYIDGINEVKHFTGETFEQALSEAIKSLEEGK